MHSDHNYICKDCGKILPLTERCEHSIKDIPKILIYQFFEWICDLFTWGI